MAFGYPEKALEAAGASVRLAQQLSHPLSLAQAISNMAMLHGFRRERMNAVEQAQAATALCEEQGFPTLLQMARLTQRAFASDRNTADGIKRIRRDLAQAVAGLSVNLGWLAEACLEGSDDDEAGAALAEAFAFIERSGEHLWEAELYRLRGETEIDQSS